MKIKNLACPPLPQTKVFAHIAGPSGSGKTELMYALRRHVKNIALIDLDVFDEKAVENLGWESVPKDDYTLAMLRRLHKIRQVLITRFIERSRRPLVLFGHHIESGFITKFSTENRFLLKVSPKTAAVRRGKRQGLSKAELLLRIAVGQEDIEMLLRKGYIPTTPRRVYTIISCWSKELQEV